MPAIIPADVLNTPRAKPALPRAVVGLGWTAFIVGFYGLIPALGPDHHTTVLIFLALALGGFSVVVVSAFPWGLYQVLFWASMSLVGGIGGTGLILGPLWLIPRFKWSVFVQIVLLLFLMVLCALFFGVLFYAIGPQQESRVYLRTIGGIAGTVLGAGLGIVATEYVYRLADKIRVWFGAAPRQKRVYAFAEGEPIENLP